MMATKGLRGMSSLVAGTVALGMAFCVPAQAAPRHHGVEVHHGVQIHRGGVMFARTPSRGGSQALVSDGPGTGFGFHRLPGPYRYAAADQRARQSDAVHRAVVDDALTSGNYHSGFLGDSVYGAGNGAAYGVFNGADGYGSPYFAGYYGPGDGADYGPFGHAYTN